MSPARSANPLLDAAVDPAPGAWRLVLDGGEERPVPLDRWLGAVTAADEAVLSRAAAPVLDIGCGPGRHVHALARRGMLALGVDVSPAAVRLARLRGAPVHEGSIFRAVPGAGTWGSALLLDGNLGIGGDPVRLLRRVARLLRPGGVALVEVDPPGWPTQRVSARLVAPRALTEPFAWALVGADGVGGLASQAGLAVTDLWRADTRWFAALA